MINKRIHTINVYSKADGSAILILLSALVNVELSELFDKLCMSSLNHNLNYNSIFQLC